MGQHKFIELFRFWLIPVGHDIVGIMDLYAMYLMCLMALASTNAQDVAIILIFCMDFIYPISGNFKRISSQITMQVKQDHDLLS